MSKYNQMAFDRSYKIYMSDSIYYSAREKMLTSRFYDLMNATEDSRTPDEIALSVITNAGLRVE